MELTRIKSSLFGYRKTDVVRYISELNELHNAELGAKLEEITEIKGKTVKEIERVTAQRKTLEDKIASHEGTIASLEETISKLTAQLDDCVRNYNTVTEEYESLKVETMELREKSEVISTAIINAEKCADQLVGKAKEEADDMIKNAEDKVRYEKDRLNKAKECVRLAREELRNTMHEIDSALSSAETELEAKAKSVDNSESKNDRKIDISLFKRA